MKTKTVKCETCDGTGECMEMVCYGGLPYERECDCPDCNGRGEIEVPAQPEIDIMQATREMLK